MNRKENSQPCTFQSFGFKEILKKNKIYIRKSTQLSFQSLNIYFFSYSLSSASNIRPKKYLDINNPIGTKRVQGKESDIHIRSKKIPNINNQHKKGTK